MDGWSHSLHVSFVFLVNLKKYFNEVELSALGALLLGSGNVAWGTWGGFQVQASCLSSA